MSTKKTPKIKQKVGPKTDNISLVANPCVVFREEFDDWAVLFDPDSGETYGLNPTSAFIWKKLDGKRSMDEIIRELNNECEGGIPEEAPKQVNDFVEDLKRRGLVGIKE